MRLPVKLPQLRKSDRRSEHDAPDPLTSASTTTAWVVVANKPFYPLYVWWVAGSGVEASLWTLLATPLFAALPFLARRSPYAARVGLPLIGAADSLFSTLMFGQSSGVEAFLAPCAALAALSFRASEAWTARALTVLMFVIFSGLRFVAPTGAYPWSPEAAAAIVNLNLYCVASLLAFIGLRFAARG